MNKQGWVGALVGLVAGILLGYLVLPGLLAENEGKRGDGGGPATPSSLSNGFPPGTWSNVPCGSGSAAMIADDIQATAIADLNSGQITPQLFSQVNNLLYQCALGEGAWSGAGPDKCDVMAAAKRSADQHQWSAVIQHLQTAQ